MRGCIELAIPDTQAFAIRERLTLNESAGVSFQNQSQARLFYGAALPARQVEDKNNSKTTLYWWGSQDEFEKKKIIFKSPNEGAFWETN
jgi:hypothetical protein